MCMTKTLQSAAAVAGVAMAGAFTLVGPPAAAQSWASIRCGDTAALNAAIMAGNAAGSAVIRLAPGCSYAITTPFAGPDGLTPITGNITIEAGRPREAQAARRDRDGLATLVRRSTVAFRILHVNPGGRLTLRGIAVRNGNTTGSGGGIDTNGDLTLDHSEVTGNTARVYGGGIGSDTTTVTTGRVAIVDSRISRNTAADGGGIAVTGALTVTRGTVYGNRSTDLAGGVFALGPVALLDTSLDSNATTGLGGGVVAASAPASLLIRGGRVLGNTAGIGGGGIYVGSAAVQARLDNTKVASNAAPGGGGMMITRSASFVSVNRSTFTWNRATDVLGGGAIYNAATLTVSNSTLHANTAASGPGGGLENTTGTATFTTSRVENNSAVSGGGIHVTGGTVTIQRTVVIRNRPDNCAPAGVVVGCVG